MKILLLTVTSYSNNFIQKTFNQTQVMTFHCILELLPLWSVFLLHYISFPFKYCISNSNNCNLYNSSIIFQTWNTLDDACLIPVNQFSKIYLFPNFNQNNNFQFVSLSNSYRQIQNKQALQQKIPTKIIKLSVVIQNHHQLKMLK